MAKLFENTVSLEEYPRIAFLLANLKSLSPHLDFEISPTILQGKVYIFATPDKGHPDEEGSLEAMEIVLTLLREGGLRFETLFRNTPNGNRVDGVRIWLFQLPAFKSL